MCNIRVAIFVHFAGISAFYSKIHTFTCKSSNKSMYNITWKWVCWEPTYCRNGQDSNNENENKNMVVLGIGTVSDTP